jgi:uncharacterized membrane protein YhfC
MDLLIITRFLNGFLMIALPIALGIFLVARFKLSWKLWLIGGVIFVISQVFHLPFNSYILNPLLGSIQKAMPGLPGSLEADILLGLSAGVFEEFARYAMFRWWLADKRTWRVAVLAGAGHGGVEAILLGGVVMWVFINLVAVRNADLSKMNLTPDQLVTAQQQIQAYWSLPWYLTLFGALERIFTIPFHIMASVMVLQVFTRRPGRLQFGWLGLAIFLHAMMDASITFVAGQWNPYAAEAILGGLAIVDVFIILALRQPEAVDAEGVVSSTETRPPVFTPEPLTETPENLEKTRFQ